MKELINALLSSEKNAQPVNVHAYAPNEDVVALQITYKKGIVIDVAHNTAKDSYIVKVMEVVPRENAQPVTLLKAVRQIDAEAGKQIFEQHWSVFDQDTNIEHTALLINGKKTELVGTKGSK